VPQRGPVRRPEAPLADWRTIAANGAERLLSATQEFHPAIAIWGCWARWRPPARTAPLDAADFRRARRHRRLEPRTQALSQLDRMAIPLAVRDLPGGRDVRPPVRFRAGGTRPAAAGRGPRRRASCWRRC
jgi:hypothetical protein